MVCDVAKLVLLGPAHDAAGRRDDIFDGPTLDDVLTEAVTRYGPDFGALLEISQVWLNGEPAAPSTPVEPHDEIMVLPPVSGG
jgi:molybdopterin converting factor small subunit